MAKIKGIVYSKLGRRKATGLVECDTDIINADVRLRGKVLLDVLLHEGTHILQPYLTEESVDNIGIELSEMLWADGWRKVDNDEGSELQDVENDLNNPDK